MGGVTLTGLQAEGAARARTIIDRYGGVVVADSVGMGKTYVGLRLIQHAVREGSRVVVVVPATLRMKWRQALRSAGMASSPAGDGCAAQQAVSVVSHALVHRTNPPQGPALVVVDEAHQFRNPRTARYRALARLAAGAHVVLLTATPINNRPADLYWLLRLFLGDGALRDAGVPDLRIVLNDDTDRAALVRRVVDQVVIRRTRADLTAGEAGSARLRFPRHHPPRSVHYDLRAVHPLLIEVLEHAFRELRLSAFDLSSSRPDDATPIHTAALVRIGLLKRLESSTAAFRASIVRLLRFLDAFDDALAAGGYLRPRDARGSDPLQLSFTGLLALPLPRAVDRARLTDDNAADRRVLRRLLDQLKDEPDCAKTAMLHSLLADLGSEPRVVFTEYAETAEALFAALPKDHVAMVHGSRAAMASGRVSRRAILEAFVPDGAGPRRLEHVHTLITTDLLAEGVDLHAARHCISYDLPWNPVRLMQRAGRVDRLGSPHADVFVWYFEPAAEVDRLLGLMRRLGAKVRTIERTVGAEHGAAGSPAGMPESALRCGVAADAEDSAPDCAHALRHLVHRTTTAEQPAYPLAGCAAAARLVIRGMTSVPSHILLLATKQEGSPWVSGWALASEGATPFTMASITRLLTRLHPALQTDDVSAKAALVSRADASIAAIEAAIRSVRAAPEGIGAPAPAAVRKAADALRRALARHPGGPDPRLCRRADRILQVLEFGVPAGLARTLDMEIERHASADAAVFCSALEAVARRFPSSRARRRERLLAALLIEASSG